MKGLIVTNGFTCSLSQVYKVRRLKEEFARLSVLIEEKTTLELVPAIKDGAIVSRYLDSYSFCVFLDKDRYLSYAIEDKMPLFNSADAIKICDDKMDTYLALRGMNVKTPKTVAAPLCYDPSPDPNYIQRFVKNIESELSYPLVAKECYGSLGKQVYLITCRDELVKLYSRLIHVPHLYQEYIESSCGRDVRMFTIGGTLVAAMERINLHDFRSNVSTGGIGQKINPSAEFIQAAEEVSQRIGLAYAGIDLMFGPRGEPILAEINSNAFFTEIERVSGVNVTRLLCQHIVNKINA